MEKSPKAASSPVSDGHPSDSVQYREYKLILRPDRFTSPEGLHEFGKLVRSAAKKEGVGVARTQAAGENLLREIVFYDTPAFDLYEGAFILRQRAQHRDGWPVGDSELTLKFRHPELDAAAKIDVRPATEHAFRIKFKEEVLPPTGRAAGMRSLYSHNVVLTLPPDHLQKDVERAARVFPTLRDLLARAKPLEVVQRARITEVLDEVGVLDFGHGLTAKATVALWRTGVVGPVAGRRARLPVQVPARRGRAREGAQAGRRPLRAAPVRGTRLARARRDQDQGGVRPGQDGAPPP